MAMTICSHPLMFLVTKMLISLKVRVYDLICCFIH